MNFFYTHISEEAVRLAAEVLHSTFVSAGKLADRFESELRDRLGLVNPVTVNSGTSALHLALAVAGVGPGDEVIIPAQTFIATGHAVLMHYATPVFADIQYETGNIDPASIRQKISVRTRAVIPVHWGGYPCDLAEINEIAKEHNIAVIEDAAHALGATYKNKPVGAISRFTAFSFQAIKHLTTVDGGALCCLDELDTVEAKKRRWFDIDRENAKPSPLGERIYDADRTGYKCHMNDLCAAIGLGNIDEFPANLRRRREIADIYLRELKDIPGLQLLKYSDDRESAYWLFTILTEHRTNFIKKLHESGIPASVVHQRIDKNTVFGGITPDLENQQKFNDMQVSIPVHSALTDDDVMAIINTVKTGW